MTHILGLERLFALRGPLKPVDSPMIYRFFQESLRPLLIHSAFFMRRPSIMGRPEWKASSQLPDFEGRTDQVRGPMVIPYHPDMDFLMDVLAVIPALYVQYEECLRLAGTGRLQSLSEGVNAFQAATAQQQERLHIWKENWDEIHEHDMCEIKPTITKDFAPASLWQTAFRFKSDEMAARFTMFHTTVILLNNIPAALLDAGLLQQPTSSEPGPDLWRPLLPETKTSVHNICRSIEHYLQFLRPSQAPADFYLYFPMHIARRACRQSGYPSELAWLEKAFELMKSRFPMGMYVNMNFPDNFSGLRPSLFG